MRRSIPAALLVLALAPGTAGAQTELSPPRSHALTNARIVVAPGRVIERGTVVVRDGRIAAVGERVEAPAGVVTIDVAGKTVFAGLIDAASGAGLPRLVLAGGGRGGGPPGSGPNAESAGPPPELNPGRTAADEFRPGEGELAGYRAAGFTTLGLAFDGGIFPGRVSAVTLRDGEAGRQVLRPAVAQQIGMGTRRGAYPTTSMGTVAYVKQSFADARYDARVAAAFQRSPATAPRPAYDPEHVALQPAAAGSMPVWVSASGAADMQRVIALMDEIGVSDYVIVGAREGYQVADRLKATGRPVIVSVNFPEPGQVTGRAYELHIAPPTGEDSAKAQADSAALKTLRGNAAALVRAGVPVALSGAGLSGGVRTREAILAAVEAGLPPDEALRALTVTPARLLGLEGALGTVEAGKLANLIVVEGDLFSKDGKVRHVFVEGEKYDIAEEARRPAAGRGGGAGEARAAGQWSGTMDAQGNPIPFTLTIAGAPDALTGSLATDMGPPAELRGSLQGTDVTLRGTVAPPGMATMEIQVVGRITGDEMSGTVSAGDMGSFSFTARRTGPGGQPDVFHGGER